MTQKDLEILQSKLASCKSENEKESLQELISACQKSPKTFKGLTLTQLMRVAHSLQQVREGNVYSHEQVMQMARGWISKLNGQQTP